ALQPHPAAATRVPRSGRAGVPAPRHRRRRPFRGRARAPLRGFPAPRACGVKTLALVAGDGVPPVEGDTTLVAWDEAAERALRARSVNARTVAQVLGAEAAEEVDTAAVRWTKDWGRQPLLDGCSFRDLYEWKGVSLWWFAELFLHHSTEAARYVRV